MSRPLTAFQPVRGDALRIREAFLSDPGNWLPDARPAGPATWHVPVFFGAIHRVVRCEVGSPWHAGDTAWRRLAWTPEATAGDVAPVERMLPVLTAEIGLTPGPSGCSLVLNGNYEVPASPMGEFADVVLLHRVARRTAVRFLGDIAEALDRIVVTT